MITNSKKPKRRLKPIGYVLLIPPILVLTLVSAWLVSLIKPAPAELSDVRASPPQTLQTIAVEPAVAHVAIEITPYLELVNSQFAISRNIEDYEVVNVFGVVPASTSCIELNPTALSALRDLFAEAKAHGFAGFYLSSGFRNTSQQAELYENAPDRSFVQPPGHSEHHTGLAADVAYLGESMARFDSSDHGRWFMQNAHRFGFILRYPADKTHITGISYEPWHYRYVGREHAEFMFSNNLVLEEYIQLLEPV
jgi:D-alanyl-D-alanine carboxypeptidase